MQPDGQIHSVNSSAVVGLQEGTLNGLQCAFQIPLFLLYFFHWYFHANSILMLPTRPRVASSYFLLALYSMLLLTERPIVIKKS